MIRPSSLPILAQCPCFESGEAQDFTDAGTVRHGGFAEALRGNADWRDIVPEDERDAVEWAASYVKMKSDTANYPLRIEEKVGTAFDDDFNPLWDGDAVGTADAICGNQIFDLKWRQRDYTAQMAAYALALLQRGFHSVTCHILFAESKHVKVITFTEAEAAKIVGDILKTLTPDAKPKQNSYCGWCKKQAYCAAVMADVAQITHAREEITEADKQAFAAWLAAGAHTSGIPDDAKLLGQILRIAKVLGKWVEAAEHHIKESALKRGVIADGFKLQTRQGNRVIPSVTDAFAKIGLPQDEFLKACSVGFTDLVETFKTLHGMKKAQAERTVEEKLGDALTRKSSSVSLVAVKGE